MNRYSPFQLMACFRRASSIMRLRRSIDAMAHRRFALGGCPAQCSNGSRVALREGAIHSFEPRGTTRSLWVIEGNVWITQEGSSRDFVLGRGERCECAESGKIVLQALNDCVIDIADVRRMSQDCDAIGPTADSRDHDNF